MKSTTVETWWKYVDLGLLTASGVALLLVMVVLAPFAAIGWAVYKFERRGSDNA